MNLRRQGGSPVEATTTAQLFSPSRPLFEDARLAVGGFLGPLLEQHPAPGYACDLRAWFAWCAQARLEVFAVRRPHIELYARWMEEDSRAGHDRPAPVDGGGLLPLRRHRRLPGRVPGRARAAPQDPHRVHHPRCRPHGARSISGPGGGRWTGGPRPCLSSRASRTACFGGLRHRRRTRGYRAGPPPFRFLLLWAQLNATTGTPEYARTP